MPELITDPVRIEAAGSPPKVIREFIGRVRTPTEQCSIAWMKSPQGWSEPGQTPDFDEYTIVLNGSLTVEYAGGGFEVEAGQALWAKSGEWIRYSTPKRGGAEYIAVCVPAFSPETVHRDV